MGISPLFCCFKRKNPVCITLIGLITNIIIFAFLCWPADKLVFFRTGIEAVFWIAFLIVILCLFFFLIITIILCLKHSKNNQSVCFISKVICIVIIGTCFVAWVFILTTFIGDLKDYVDMHDLIKEHNINFDKDNTLDYNLKNLNFKNKTIKRNMLDIDDIDIEDYLSLDLDDDGDLSSLDWATVTFPLILNLIGLILMILCANYLYKVFIDDSVEPVPTQVDPSIVTTTPIIQQPQLLPNNTPINIVPVQQTEQNIVNK